MPSFKRTALSALALLLFGWGGLFLMIFYYQIPPLVWARWGFFALLTMGLTGAALPVVHFLHLRFPAELPVEPQVIARQAIWVGVYGSTLAWLQLGRLTNLYVVFGLAVGLLAIEYFIRLREAAARPSSSHDEPSA